MKLTTPVWMLLLGAMTSGASAADRIAVPSFTPEDYAEILTGAFRSNSVVIDGYLSHPAPGTKAPAVVIVPGSGGYAEWMQRTIAAPLNEIGIATLIVDSFAGRGVKETATDQSRVPMSASVMDGFSALAALAARSDIDPTRVAITGFSRGGVASMFAGERRLIEAALPGGPRFAASLPFYPGCSTQMAVPVPTAAPIRFMLGADDDYTPAQNCIDYIDRLRAAGAVVDYKLYEGANHAWMADYPPRRANVQTFGDCDLKIEADGQIKDMKSGATTREGWKTFAQNVMRACGGRGATVGANPQAREAAIADMVVFFRNTLLK